MCAVTLHPHSVETEKAGHEHPEWRNVEALRVGECKPEKPTRESPHFTRDFAWIVSADIDFIICSPGRMSTGLTLSPSTHTNCDENDPGYVPSKQRVDPLHLDGLEGQMSVQWV